jgi:hypothetical protein
MERCTSFGRPDSQCVQLGNQLRYTLLYLYLTANGFSPGGSGTTIRHNTQITHIIQK